MSADGKQVPPPYFIPVEAQGSGGKGYHVHTPFTPQEQGEQAASASSVTPDEGQESEVKVYDVHTPFTRQKPHPPEPSIDPPLPPSPTPPPEPLPNLGREPGKANCPDCKEQVITDVTYKAGTYAWLMCLLFICCGLFLCCCLIPFFLDSFKDAHHLCPRCSRVLHVEKKQCCK